MLKTHHRHTNRRLFKRAGMLALLSQVCLLQFGGCFNPELMFAAAADSLAFTAVQAAQGFLFGLLGLGG